MSQYAVVSFLDEFVDGEQLVSEVPISWLHSSNTMCKWPLGFEAHHIMKYSAPKPEWTDHRVRCERICDSREEARRKCMRDPEDGSTSSASDSFVGRRIRKKKPNKFRDYYSTCPSPPQLDSEDSTPSQCSNMENVKSDSGQCVQETVDITEFPQIEEPVYTELRTSTLHQQHTLQQILAPYQPITLQPQASQQSSTQPSALQQPTISQQSPTVLQPLNLNNDAGTRPLPTTAPIVFNRGKRPTTIDEKLDLIINMLGALKVEIDDLKKINNGYPPRGGIQIQDADFNFPLTSITQLEALETKIKGDTDFKQQLIQYLRHIGGMSVKDLHTRCCRKMFSNSLSELCSWKGFRNNHKIEHLTIIQCLYDSVNSTFPCTFKEFEILTRDYLRHAKQRREREENSKKT